MRTVGRSGGRTARVLAACLAAWLSGGGLATPVAAQLHGQHWDVTTETARATVGDTVTVHFRVRLDERDLLFDTVPRPLVSPPDWVRILSVDKLERQPDRIFVGRAWLAFYRPGVQPIPIFQLPFMRSVKGLSRGTFASDSATVEIMPVLQAGGTSATLRDIKESRGADRPNPWELLLGVSALCVAGGMAWRARRSSQAAAAPPAPLIIAPGEEAEPYALALGRLEDAAADLRRTGDIARHYQTVADTLRDYLEAYGIPARERTTSELRWSLPPELLAGTAEKRFAGLFEAADLVKFAHWRPDAVHAETFLRGARELLTRWHAARAADAASHAGAESA